MDLGSVLCACKSLLPVVGKQSHSSYLLCAAAEKDKGKSRCLLLPESTLCPWSAKLGVSAKDNGCRTGESAFCAEVQVLDLFSSLHARTHTGIHHIRKHRFKLRKAFVF